MEPKRTSDVDSILSNYTKSIKNGSGGLLFSIVGGKMSEGINFSDELARCVCVVGMPYPNIGSAEMIEKNALFGFNEIKIDDNRRKCWKSIL